MKLIGLHVDDLAQIIDENYQHIKLFQIFVEPSEKFIEKNKHFFNFVKQHKIKLAVHASYSVNLARNWQPSDWWIEYMINEINICDKIGAFALVFHVGKHKDLSIQEATNNMYTALLHVHRQTSKSNVKLLLETAAGQGTEMFSNIVDFCNFLAKFYNTHNEKIVKRFGCCIDTCHVFVAGYDITNKTEIDKIFKLIDDIIGLDKIKLCHLNDSKVSLGSHKDRHQNIGKGYIGQDALLYIVRLLHRAKIPTILETPHAHTDIDLFY